jgi:integrase
MPQKLPKYVRAFTDNRGKRRHYFRRKGFAEVALPSPWEPDFLEAYHEAASSQGPVGKTHTPSSGTLGALIVAYLGSNDYQSLATTTKKTYRLRLDVLRRDAGTDRVADFRPEHLRGMIAKRTKERGPEAGNNLRRMLRLLFKLAVARNMRKDDPAAAIEKNKPTKGSKDGHRAWTEADIEAFIAKHPLITRANLALSLLLYTGQRRSDVVKLGPKNIKGTYDPKDFAGRKLTFVQQKTGAALTMPVHPVLAEALAQANIPADAPAFLLTKDGEPFSAEGFTNYFTRRAREAGIEGQASPHGLRKAAARRLAEAGCSVNVIASITGHASLKEVQRYTQAADQERLADIAMQAISRPKDLPPPS